MRDKTENLGGSRHRALGRRAFLVGSLGAAGAGLLGACGGGGATSTSGDRPALDTTPPTASLPGPAATARPAAPSPAASPAVASPSPVASPAAAASPSPVAWTPPGGVYTRDNPPPVANAVTARRYRGQWLIYYGDSSGTGAALDQVLSARFTKDTGIAVQVVAKPPSSAESYATYQRLFQAKSPNIDVLMIDVIWSGALAPHLVDLGQMLGDEARQHYPTSVENNTVAGRLVAMPWFGDLGMLYCRIDLLQKHGFGAPPRTWDELERQAKQIADGERASRPNFTGFVFQGHADEGLTCNALEWLASTGGGAIVEDGRVTINNPQAVAILNKARGWVGTIAPRGVTAYQDEDARNVFQRGDAAFTRQWSHAYATMANSGVRGRYIAAPLPAAPGYKPVGAVGGWQLAVSQYSKDQDPAIELVRYLTSPEVQTWRAVVGGFVPTIPAVAEHPVVITAQPFLDDLGDVVRVMRPSRSTGARYTEVSAAVAQGVNQILNGADAARVVPQIEQRIQA